MKKSYEESDANRESQVRALHGLRQMSVLNKIPSLGEVAIWRVRVTNVSVQRIPCSLFLHFFYRASCNDSC